MERLAEVTASMDELQAEEIVWVLMLWLSYV
jgi:hypothetical protein